jgi:large subunit ribosomal protein L15
MSMIQDITAGAPRNTHRTRKGRGESSGHGKTSGRGTKGAKARVGTYIKRGHEGGQTPIFRRFPKRGFSNYDFERRFHIVNLSDLNAFKEGTVVDSAVLREAGLVPNSSRPVKILGEGELSKKLTVQVGWYSKAAFAKIVAAGGAAQNIKGQTFEFPKPKKKFVPREPVKKKVATEEPAEAKPEAAKEKPEAAKEKPEAAKEKPEAAKAKPEAPKAEPAKPDSV